MGPTDQFSGTTEARVCARALVGLLVGLGALLFATSAWAKGTWTYTSSDHTQLQISFQTDNGQNAQYEVFTLSVPIVSATCPGGGSASVGQPDNNPDEFECQISPAASSGTVSVTTDPEGCTSQIQNEASFDGFTYIAQAAINASLPCADFTLAFVGLFWDARDRIPLSVPIDRPIAGEPLTLKTRGSNQGPQSAGCNFQVTGDFREANQTVPCDPTLIPPGGATKTAFVDLGIAHLGNNSLTVRVVGSGAADPNTGDPQLGDDERNLSFLVSQPSDWDPEFSPFQGDVLSGKTLKPSGQTQVMEFGLLGDSVAHVDVAIAKVTSTTCRWVSSLSSTLTRPRPLTWCDPPTWLRATGTRTWSLRLQRSLPAGKYLAIAQVTDTAGRQSPLPSSANSPSQETLTVP